MKELLRVIVVACGLMAVTVAQSRTAALAPDEVLKRFLSMETRGLGLEPAGWNRIVASFFVRPIPPPENIRIAVVAYPYGVGDSAVKGTTARVDVGYEQLGMLDASLRFLPTKPKIETRNICSYDLTLTTKHWTLNNDKHETEVNGDPEWRIENHQCEMLLTPRAAVRYVTEARNKASDPLKRKNADKSLALLKDYVRAASISPTK